MQRAPLSWVIDLDDPRAPPQEIWDQLSPDERRHLLDALPSDFEIAGACPPEGDPHFNAKIAAKDVLGGYFQRLGRRVYLACEMAVYYPGERVFSPDLIAVLDVELKSRGSWTVSQEGKGVDLALEILWAGSAKKDLEDNVTRYAALGIPEYFIFDRKHLRLKGYRLPPGGRRYHPIVPQEGRLACSVLDLELGLEGERLRFYHGLARLPESSELLAKLGAMVGDLDSRIDEAERRAQEAERRAEDAEVRLAEALAEIERLKRERG